MLDGEEWNQLPWIKPIGLVGDLPGQLKFEEVG